MSRSSALDPFHTSLRLLRAKKPARHGFKKPDRQPEQSLNDKIMDAMRGLDPVRVENSCGDGYPDINFTSGWIEDKVVAAWPKRPDTPIRVPHYTREQRGWQVKRRAAGGLVLVALQVADTVMILDALDAAEHVGFASREALLRRALLVMTPFDPQRFRRWLSEYSEKYTRTSS